MADKHKKDEAGAPEPDEVTEVTEAAAPAEDEPAAAAASAASADRAGTTAAEQEETTAVMADSGEEVTQVAGDAGDGATAVLKPARRPSRSRRILVGFLVLLCCLAVVVSGVTLWVHYTVMNTNGYMNLVGPIGKDPVAIQNLSSYIAGQAVTATDLQQRVGDALPPKAQLFAGPITGVIEDFIKKGTTKVLSSPRAYDLWLQINRVGHEKVVALLRGQTNGVYIQGNDVTLNLLPLVSQVLVWADGKLPGGLSTRFNPPVITPDMSPQAGIQEVANWSGKPLPSDFGQITLLQSSALGPAQTAVKWFDRLTWILPLITAALIALTIWLSRRRGRTAIAIGIGAAIAIFVTRVIVVRGSGVPDRPAQVGRRAVVSPRTSSTPRSVRSRPSPSGSVWSASWWPFSSGCSAVATCAPAWSRSASARRVRPPRSRSPTRRSLPGSATTRSRCVGASSSSA